MNKHITVEVEYLKQYKFRLCPVHSEESNGGTTSHLNPGSKDPNQILQHSKGFKCGCTYVCRAPWDIGKGYTLIWHKMKNDYSGWSEDEVIGPWEFKNQRNKKR